MQAVHTEVSGNLNRALPNGNFLSRLSTATRRDLDLLLHPSTYEPGNILFTEGNLPTAVYIVLDGEVKLSMNSSLGKRLILRIAKKGEILGLASVLSGKGCEMTAETLFPSKIARIDRADFLNFLRCHQEVYETVTEEMSRNYNLACEQLRTIGLSFSAPGRLARLLLDWSADGQAAGYGTQVRFSFTHEEVGEFIGASRETVTRTLSTFRNRQVVAFSGSMLTINDKVALESYAVS